MSVKTEKFKVEIIWDRNTPVIRIYPIIKQELIRKKIIKDNKKEVVFCEISTIDGDEVE